MYILRRVPLQYLRLVEVAAAGVLGSQHQEVVDEAERRQGLRLELSLFLLLLRGRGRGRGGEGGDGVGARLEAQVVMELQENDALVAALLALELVPLLHRLVQGEVTQRDAASTHQQLPLSTERVTLNVEDVLGV